MTGENRHVVCAELVAPVQELLEGVVDGAAVALGEHTVCGGVLAVPGVGELGRACLVDVDVVVGCELEVFEEAHFEVAGGVEGVAFGAYAVEDGLRQGVGLAVDGTFEAGVVFVAVVIALEAVGVNEDVAVGVADIKRIDGCYLGGGGKHVARRCGGAVFVESAALEVGVAHVGAHFEPVFCLGLGGEAAGEAFVVG